ncbi:hypothetical protein [Paraliobacillus sp. JSM ZJ581]|uniref:hypothetical protein n=1 Tax=Paraliobacillus sp. JSM ZJ581 TaxID=3342118 RepID=UPI0035A89DD6
MQEIKNSFALYWKIAKSKKITLLLFLLSFFYNIYFFYFFIVGDRDPAEALVRSSFIVQGGILASMMIGVYLSNLERKVGLEELIETISHAKTTKNIGKVLFFLSFLFLYLMVNIGTIILMFIVTDVPYSPFYVQSFLYIILYWGFSFVLGGLIGTVLAMWIKGRMIYVLSLVIWLFISPLNYPFVIQLGILFQWSHVDEIENFLNIGQNNPHHSYQPFYGFALENYQWLKRTLFVLFLLLLIVGSLMIQRRVWKKYLPVFLILFAITSYTAFGVFGKHQVLHLNSEEDGILKKDSTYYQDVVLKDNASNQYQITSYDIDLDIRKYLKADVVMEVRNSTSTEMNTFDFLLYHDLKVDKILDENGDKLEFSQKKDMVKVTTKESVQPNEFFQMKFQYEGISSPFFFANHQAINLLNHFPWLPSKSHFNSAMVTIEDEAFRLPNQPNQEIKYEVKLKGNSSTTSNLEKVGKNEWSGVSSDGIYLIAGSVGEQNINGKSVVYPYTWEKMLAGFTSFEDLTQNKIDKINEELQLQRKIKIDRYVLLDQSLSTEMPEQHVWIYGNSFFMSPAGFLFNDESGLLINIDYMTYGIVPAMTWKYDRFFSQDIAELHLFNIAYSHFLNMRESEDIKEKYSNFAYFEFRVKELQEQESELGSLAAELKTYIDNENISEITKVYFFREWYRSILSESTGFNIADEMSKK